MFGKNISLKQQVSKLAKLCSPQLYTNIPFPIIKSLFQFVNTPIVWFLSTVILYTVSVSSKISIDLTLWLSSID